MTQHNKDSLFSLQSEQRIGESAAIHRDERADLPAAHSPREQPPRETIRENPKQFGTSRYEKEPENRLSLPSKICGGSQEIQNIVIVCSVMYLPVESGLENRNITEIVHSLGNSSYSQNSPFLSTFSTRARNHTFAFTSKPVHQE